MTNRGDDRLATVREICLSLPEAAEKETWGHPTFRVRNKIFATYGPTEDGSAAMTMKAPPGDQEALLATGGPFFYPAYVGSKGWIGVSLDAATNWTEVAEIVEDSYRLVAPKTLVRRLDDSATG